ncbi:putative quinol monooxygenase [Oceanicoccus sp. KOV_DT_Chl]|uniref:putative quinol monooxygenase n=1 Tax=Oceanicoccus sp. KOV_DT_Chl TaxID=1904639 RepID=UPI000C7CBE8C|nr:antibiotic biosynthesis monooxygenase [Oceanicoccus sp. KOV_DT_Chl]
MTVLVAGTVEVKAEDRAKALADATALMAETRSQKGCQHYVWSADPTSDTRIYVYENWDSSEDLSAHLAGPFYAKMLGVLGSYDVSNVEVSKFKIALEEPVYDPEGKPRGDFFTG